MKKFLLIFFLCLSAIVLAKPIKAQENDLQNKTTIYFFWSETCPHCHEEKPFLKEFVKNHPEAELQEFELSDSDNFKLLKSVLQKLKEPYQGYPFTIIGSKGIAGFDTKETTGKEIEILFEEASTNKVRDIVQEAMDDNLTSVENPDNLIYKEFHIPFFGKASVSDFSLPVLAVILGLVDGFNPCAMWTLMFLISLLLGMKNRTRMWALGSAFILVSAGVYYIIMVLWLKFFEVFGVLGYSFWIQKIVGIVALVAAGYNFYDYYTNKEGQCKVTQGEKKKKFFEDLKKITLTKSFLLSLIGIILLAISVNIVELVCSAGIPAIFVEVLTQSNLFWMKYHLYLLIYIFFFMLDDLIVFFSAMTTLKLIGLDGKYSKYSRLIGGALILIIGLLLLFKPEWLMFV